MQIRKRKISATSAILLALVIGLGTVLGAIVIQWSLNIPAQWNVSVSQGLALYQSDGITPVTAMSFTVAPLSSITESFVLKNIGNSAVNVTDSIPDSTSLYQFTTSFVNSTSGNVNTIVQGGSYAFSITLMDLGMDSSTQYSGNFAYNIASGFSAGSSSFGTTTVNYASDTASYFGFVSDSFNASNYPVGSTMLYSFTTQDINPTYEIQGISYTLQVLDASNNVVSTPASGLLVAYYENSTAYGTYGNGTHMTDMPLLPGQSMTIWTAFSVPTTPGVYHLQLTYDGHNAAMVNPPITWTISIVNLGGIHGGSDISVENVVITGGTAANDLGTVSFTISNYYDNNGISYSFSATVPELSLNIGSHSDYLNRYASKTYTYSFTPTAGGALTMQISTTEISG